MNLVLINQAYQKKFDGWRGLANIDIKCSFALFYNPYYSIITRGRTYVMITYVSKENNLGPDDKIRYIWGLKGPIFIL